MYLRSPVKTISDSGGCRSPNPVMPIADSDGCRSVIPVDVDHQELRKGEPRLDKLEKIDDPLRKGNRGGNDATKESIHAKNRRNPEIEI
jgi:hypothetical protein